MGYFDDTRFHSMDEMVDAINTVVERNLYELATEVTAEDLGLDRRAGYRLLVTEDYIIVYASNRGVLDYYGGFEYVDAGCVSQMGDYVFYSAEDDRVADCLEYYYGRDVEEDEVEPDVTEAEEWYDFDPDC